MTAGKTVQGFATVKIEHTFYFNCAFSSKGKFNSTFKILIENLEATTSVFYSTFTEKENMPGYFNGAAGFVVDTFVFLQSSQIAETKNKRGEKETKIEKDLLEEMVSCLRPGTDFSIYVHTAEVNLSRRG